MLKSETRFIKSTKKKICSVGMRYQDLFINVEGVLGVVSAFRLFERFVEKLERTQESTRPIAISYVLRAIGV